MGKGGGPTSSTTVTSNIPEYAQPYVENMLGAAEQQVFTTNAAGDYSGFRPYTPYSTNPQDYFAGPTGLQQQAYSEAQQMQTPGQFYTGTGLTGLAGLGQLGTTQRALGAGSQYASQVTNPNAIQAYMSPYQQGVTDVAKQAAIREAQLAQNQANLGAARQGTYGGARQALARSERERNLLTNLSNIQTQGSQQAYDRAIANMQYGSNLGLQGLSAAQQGLAGAAATGQGLAGIGAQQQASDLARIQAQNALGQGQQQYQQGIINQAIQDYATQQQYPMMQLSTLSSLLRGLPLQSTSTQQYQAQAPIAQQAAGLLGAYGAYKGAFKEGGAVQGYFQGDAIDDTRSRIETLLSINPEKAAEYVNKSSSREVKKIGRELGIGGANVGKLGTNMAGGGIIAFNGEDGSEVELSDEEKKYLEENKYLQRSRAVKEALAPLGQLRNYDPVQKLAELGGGLRKSWTNFITEKPEAQAERFRSYSNRSEQAASPKEYVPPVKTASQREQAAKERDDKELADAAGQSSKVDYNKAEELLKASKGSRGDGIGGAGTGEGGAGGRSPYGLSTTMTGIGDAYKQVQGLLGTDKPNEQLQAYEDLIAGKQGELGMRAGEMDRMAKAIGFLKMAQNPRGIAAGALDGFESYLVSSASNKKEQDKIELDFARARADISKARREEAKGNFELAEKLYDNTQKRLNERLQATKPSEFDRMYSVYSQGEIAAGRKPSFESFRRAYSGADEDLTRLVKADAAVKAIKENPLNMQLAISKKPEDKEKYNKLIADTYRRYGIDPETGMPLSSGETASAGGGNRLRFNAKGEPV